MQVTVSSFRLLTFAVVAMSLLLAASSSDDSSDTTAAASGGDATATTSAAAGATSSPIVAELQKALQTIGYHPGSVDGIYGPHTIDAVKEFQADAGITVDGKYGPQTHKALEEAIAGSDFNWDEYAAIKEMQTEMADLGYYSGSIDGVYGPETEAAVKAVQADCNITHDGIYGPDTHSCLLDLGGDA